MLNAETAGIARSADPKTVVPLYIREFVALFCTKGRDKRRGWGWEVMDWQGVTNFEESAQNYFGRILLLRSAAARREVGERARRRRGVGVKTDWSRTGNRFYDD